MQSHNIEDVFQGHDTICSKFAHGEHAGTSVDDLIDDSVSGKVCPADLPTTVAALWKGRLWTIYGNRRVCALREYAKRCKLLGRELDKIKVIVHTAPFTHLDEHTKQVGKISRAG